MCGIFLSVIFLSGHVMTERISEIVLRLAREQLAVERPAESLAPLVVQQAPVANLTSTDLQGLPVAEADDHEFDAVKTSSSDPPCPRLRRGGAAEGAPEVGVSYETHDPSIASASDAAVASSPTVRSEFDEQPLRQSTNSTSLSSSLFSEQPDTPGTLLVSATEDSAALFSRFPGEQRDPPYPPLLRGGADTARDEPSIVERIDEHGRRMEDIVGGLEQSLAALFESQTETLNRLRDRVLEHDRRWLEQSANRRAAFTL